MWHTLGHCGLGIVGIVPQYGRKADGSWIARDLHRDATEIGGSWGLISPTAPIWPRSPRFIPFPEAIRSCLLDFLNSYRVLPKSTNHGLILPLVDWSKGGWIVPLCASMAHSVPRANHAPCARVKP